MIGVYDADLKESKCLCKQSTRMEDGRCFFDNNCRKSMVVYDLSCTICDKSYVGKTQRFLRDRTWEHFGDVWKVIETGRKKYGDDWYGSGGYARSDAFAKHFAQHCRDEPNSNAVRKKLRKIVIPEILWQGDRIRSMKSARTMQCKICMVERKQILSRFKSNKTKIMNDNSDIFSSCKCGCRFHKFARNIDPTLMMHLPQKKANSTKYSKQKRKRFSFNIPSTPTSLCRPCSDSPSVTSTMSPTRTPLKLIDTNVPGLPYRSPTYYPTNLELAQVQQYLDSVPSMEV